MNYMEIYGDLIYEMSFKLIHINSLTSKELEILLNQILIWK
jgi:hypothetical protein